MFLINSRQSRFSAAQDSRPEHPLYRGYGVILPSSFTRVLPNAFGCSPSTPVSDCGTGRPFRPRGAFRGRDCGGLPDRNAVALAGRGRLAPRSTSSRRPPRFNLEGGCGNINPLSIDYASRPRLRPRLTLGGLTFPRKPCAFGGWASHPSYRYSFRHTHSPTLHRSSPVLLRRGWRRSPTISRSATAARRLVPVIFGAGWLDR